MNKTEELIVQVAREVSEIHGTIPHLATKEYVDQAIRERKPVPKGQFKITDPKLVAKVVSAAVGLAGALSALVYAFV
jgi:hypothetical protein